MPLTEPKQSATTCRFSVWYVFCSFTIAVSLLDMQALDVVATLSLWCDCLPSCLSLFEAMDTTHRTFTNCHRKSEVCSVYLVWWLPIQKEKKSFLIKWKHNVYLLWLCVSSHEKHRSSVPKDSIEGDKTIGFSCKIHSPISKSFFATTQTPILGIFWYIKISGNVVHLIDESFCFTDINKQTTKQQNKQQSDQSLRLSRPARHMAGSRKRWPGREAAPATFGRHQGKVLQSQTLSSTLSFGPLIEMQPTEIYCSKSLM